MEDRRFDQMVKAVASGASRRSVLKGMLGLGGAALVGGAALDPEVDAARRPTPTPKPPSCPGQQTPVGGQCICQVPKAPGPYKCGPDCCTGQVTDAYPRPAGHSECCDNACCFGTCYGEELCCPTNTTAGEGDPIASVCESGECCYLPNVCTNGVCGPPSGCETNEDCGDCETCNSETGQCSSLCTTDQVCGANNECACAPGQILCGGTCVTGVCCDATECIGADYDIECIACLNGNCSHSGYMNGLPCREGSGFCLHGQCTPCVATGDPCDESVPCCDSFFFGSWCFAGTCREF